MGIRIAAAGRKIENWQRVLFKGSVFVLLLMIFGEGLGLIMIMVVGNFYSVEDAGLLLTLQNNLYLFGTIGALGLGTCFHRFVPAYLDAARIETVRGLQRWVFGVAAIGLGLVAIVYTMLLQKLPGTDEIALPIAIMAGVAVLLWGMVTLTRQLLRATQLTFWSEVSFQIIRPFGGLMILVVGALIGGSVTVVVLAMLLPLVVGIGHDVWRIGNQINGNLGKADYTPRSEWASAALHYGIINLSRVVQQRLDLFLVALMLGLEKAAVYGLVSRLARFVVLAVDPILAIFQPRVSLHYANRQTELIAQDITQGSLWIAGTAIIIAIVFLVSSPLWLTLFGDIVSPGETINLLIILILGFLFLVNSAIAYGILLMTGNEDALGRVNGVLIFLLYPPALWLAITHWGLYGAATVTASTHFLVGSAAIYLSYRLTGFWTLVVPTRSNLAIVSEPIVQQAKKAIAFLGKNRTTKK